MRDRFRGCRPRGSDFPVHFVTVVFTILYNPEGGKGLFCSVGECLSARNRVNICPIIGIFVLFCRKMPILRVYRVYVKDHTG